MTKIKNFFKNLLKDESAQGATEYILLLVVVVGLVLLFKNQISQQVSGAISQLGGKITNITGSN